MIRNTDLIEETVQLANTVVDLLRKVACVDHLVQVVNAVAGGGGGWSGNNAYTQAMTEGRALACERMRKGKKTYAGCIWIRRGRGVNRGLGNMQSGSFSMGVYFLSQAVIEQ